jgi:hypothetical protein
VETLGFLFVGALVVGLFPWVVVVISTWFYPVGEVTFLDSSADVVGFLLDSPWRPDFFRRVLEVLPTGVEVAREYEPRGEVSTFPNRLWAPHVGRHWKDNPGVDPSLILENFAQAHGNIFNYDSYWLSDRNSHLFIFNRRITVDRRGIYLWGTGWRQPSWAHIDSKVEDDWVNHPDFRTWTTTGEIEPRSWRRAIDHRYGRYASMGETLAVPIADNYLLDSVDEVLQRHLHR